MRHDSATTGSSAAASRAKSAARSRDVRSNSGRLAITPYFTTSYSPARNSRRGSVASNSGSTTTVAGGWNAPMRFLPERMVDADLPADGAVHLRQQRRRHLHDRDAAKVRRGREPGDITRHAAANRDDRAGPIGPGANQRVVDAADRREVLEAFPVGDEDRFLGGDALQPLAVEAPDRLRRDDEAPGRHAGGVEQRSRAGARPPARSRWCSCPTTCGR